MLFVYERLNPAVGDNFTDCGDINFSGLPRFSPSPLAMVIRNYKAMPVKNLNEFVRHFYHTTTILEDASYVIPTAVNHSPADWCGRDESVPESDPYFINRKTVFELLNPRYLKDLQRGRAFLLLDQSHEGYQTDWLWSWFHNMCVRYTIKPSNIIYVTGNLDAEDQYTHWADHHRLINRLCIVPYAHFEQVMGVTAYNYNAGIVPMHRSMKSLPDFQEHIKYKIHNLEKIKTFNILQKRTRAHRIWFFKELANNGLLEDNIVSMNTFGKQQTYFENKEIPEEEYERLVSLTPILPPENPEQGKKEDFESGDCGQYLTYFNEQIMLDTWCSVISEASFDNSTCFISEKTFKPIACMHPFIIYGNKGSLRRLKDMGYKTFSPFIDESYDSLDTWERIDAIVKELVRIQKLSAEEKLQWFIGMKDILEHNYKTFMYNVYGEVSGSAKKLVEHVNKNCRN